MEKRVLVTGANGFLGRVLVRALLARGHRVRAFVLPDEAIADDWGQRLDVVRGDICDARSVSTAAQGVDAICHLAALVGDWWPKAQHERVTVGGTRHVVAAAAEQAAHLILTSSICAYGDRIQTQRCSESLEHGRPQGAYGWAKQQQELLVTGLATRAPWTIIRPANIYGPGCKPWLEDTGELLRKGAPVIIGSGSGNAGLTYVDNVAELFCTALEKPASHGKTYNACDGLDVSWRRYFEDLATLLGTPPPKRAPRLLTRGVATVLPPIWRLLRIEQRPPATLEAYNLVGSDNRFPTERARRELGWKPRVGYEAGMHAVAESLKAKQAVVPG